MLCIKRKKINIFFLFMHWIFERHIQNVKPSVGRPDKKKQKSFFNVVALFKKINNSVVNTYYRNAQLIYQLKTHRSSWYLHRVVIAVVDAMQSDECQLFAAISLGGYLSCTISFKTIVRTNQYIAASLKSFKHLPDKDTLHYDRILLCDITHYTFFDN